MENFHSKQVSIKYKTKEEIKIKALYNFKYFIWVDKYNIVHHSVTLW